jgi:hypothetical protein
LACLRALAGPGEELSGLVTWPGRAVGALGDGARGRVAWVG